MKKSLLLASLLALGTSAYASESAKDWFMGVEVGSAKGSEEASGNGISVEASDSGAYYSIKGGKYIDKHRVSGSYTLYNTESNVDMSALALGYDYMFKTTSKFTPFIGANIAYSMYEATGGLAAGLNKDKIEMNGLSYGIGFGGLYAINKNFDLEFNLKYNKNTADDTLIRTADDTSINFELDYITHIGVGVNYNF